MPSTMPRRIDMHVHYLPPFYRQACIDNGHANPDGLPYLPEWCEEDHLKLMDEHNISKSILSVSSPGCHLVYGDNQLARKMARDCNSYGADVKRRRPDRFGYFASLPIPDVEGCLAEISRSIEEGCDGFILMTNAHGHYLGDAILQPVFDELNRRRALILIHPSTPQCPCSPEAAAAGQKPTKATPFAGRWPNPMLEFLLDTARVVQNLFMSGTMRQCPELKVIIPHLGGAFPPMLSRWTGYSALVPGPWQGVPQAEVEETFRQQIWFDMAGFAFPTQMRILIHGVGVPHTRMVYGSDYPFTKPHGVKILKDQMDEGAQSMFTEDEIEDLYYRNAEKLLALK